MEEVTVKEVEVKVAEVVATARVAEDTKVMVVGMASQGWIVPRRQNFALHFDRHRQL